MNGIEKMALNDKTDGTSKFFNYLGAAADFQSTSLSLAANYKGSSPASATSTVISGLSHVGTGLDFLSNFYHYKNDKDLSSLDAAGYSIIQSTVSWGAGAAGAAATAEAGGIGVVVAIPVNSG
jgi:hypothetical protein